MKIVTNNQKASVKIIKTGKRFGDLNTHKIEGKKEKSSK